MSWKIRFRSLIVGLALLAGGGASAETGSFPAPKIKGVALDWCAHFGADCGKPAADLFCREKGFATASAFAVAPNVGARGVRTLVFGDGRFCDGPTCSSFRSITCTRPDRTATTAVKPPLVAINPPVSLKKKPPTTVLVAPKTLVAPKPANPAGSRVVLVPPPKPKGKSPTAKAPAGTPLFAMPEGASLVRCLRSDCEFAVTYNFDIDPKADSQSEYFIGDVKTVSLASAFLWQVTTKPFPAFKSGAAADLKPPSLVASGEVTGNLKGFPVDFKEILGNLGRSATPRNFYIRILPVAKPGSAIVVGQPSNLIQVYYASTPPPQAPIKIYDASPPQLFSVKVLSFVPPDFEKPGRWGCVRVVGYKQPLVGLWSVWKDAYPIGADVCPKSFKGGSSYQITSFGEFVDWVTGGVTDGLDWVSDRYEDLKQLAVDIVMKYTPFGLQCEAIGKLIDDDAPGYCELAAKVAVNAGLAALGLPPSIPNYNELIDKGVDHAVELAAAEILAQTTIPCIGPCEDALREGFSQAADNLKKQSYTPGCVGTDEAHRHGREPLCLPDFIIAKPASGAVYTPPVAVVEVTRNFGDKDPENIFDQKCWLGVGIRFENQYPGGTEWGPGTPGKTKKVPAQKVEGFLFAGDGQELLPSMAKGSKIVKTVIFEPPQKHIFPWTKELWSRSQIPARDEQGPMGPDWFTLYSGATAYVHAGINCAAKGDTLAYKLPKP